MISRRNFMRFVFASAAIPAAALKPPEQMRMVNIRIESDHGLVDVRWLHEKLIPALHEAKRRTP